MLTTTLNILPAEAASVSNRLPQRAGGITAGIRICTLWLAGFFVFHQAAAQVKSPAAPASVLVDITVQNMPMQDVLKLVEAQTPYKFAYGSELMRQPRNITISANGITLSDFLTALLKGTTVTYNIIDNQIVLEDHAQPARVTLSGYITDKATGERLPGASIYLPDSHTGIVTNNYGFYSITLTPADTTDVEISYVGYKTVVKQLHAAGDLDLSFDLEHDRKQESIGRFTIANDKRADNVTRNQPALIEMSSGMIGTAPSLSGGGDVMSSVLLMPGVQAGMDGMPGYSVRGGNTGQNLVLLDEATLYNPGHLFGLVSIFNGPAIKSANLMKGGFPAAYGDHVSSVLDVSMKDGSREQYGGVAQVGLLASGITLYGPLEKDKSSFLVAARRSSIDVLLHPFTTDNYFSNYYFYDLNGKLNFQVSHHDRLLFSFYGGLDKNSYSTTSTSADNTGIDYGMHFGNTAFSARWNHLYSPKLFGNTSVVYNHYHQSVSAIQGGYFAELYSGIRDMNVKTDLSWYPSPVHKVTAGLDYLYQTWNPATVSSAISNSDSSLAIDPGLIPEKNAARAAVYASDELRLGEHFDLYAGVRAPYYYRGNVRYVSLEPRLSALYLLDPTTSVKLAYTQMHQYIHLVQSYNSSFPAEIWIGSSPVVRPEISNEISGGLFKNFGDNVYQASLEGYYQRMFNQLLFRGGTTPTIDNNIDDQLIFGRGWSYGTELLLRKNRGRLTGWLAYAFAYAFQQFDSLNNGMPFPSAFDRRHSLYMAASYQLCPHWKVSADFYLASGKAFTLNTRADSLANSGGGSGSGDTNPLYDDQGEDGTTSTPATPATQPENNYRLTPYNRLDLGISYTRQRNTRHGILETEWILSVYNVYARRNTSFAYRAIDPVSTQVVARQVPLIPVIPNLTCCVKF